MILDYSHSASHSSQPPPSDLRPRLRCREAPGVTLYTLHSTFHSPDIISATQEEEANLAAQLGWLMAKKKPAHSTAVTAKAGAKKATSVAMRVGVFIGLIVVALVASRSSSSTAPSSGGSSAESSSVAGDALAKTDADSCRADPSEWTKAYAADGMQPALKSFGAAHNASLFWGHFRPSVYWGLRTRTWPTAAALGMMWASPIPKSQLPKQPPGAPRLPPSSRVRIRHECREGDGVAPFGFDRHDGRSFARQRISDTDAGVLFVTQFAKPQLLPSSSRDQLGAPPPLPGRNERTASVGLDNFHWVARVAGEPLAGSTSASSAGSASKPLVVMFYVGFDCDGMVEGTQCVQLPEALGSSALEVEALPGGGLVVRPTVGLASHSSTVGASPDPPNDVLAWELRVLPPTIGDSSSKTSGSNHQEEGDSEMSATWAWRGVGPEVLLADIEAHLQASLTKAALAKDGSSKKSGSPKAPPEGFVAAINATDGHGKRLPVLAPSSGANGGQAANKVALMTTVRADQPFQLDLLLLNAPSRTASTSADIRADGEVSASADPAVITDTANTGSALAAVAAKADAAAWRAWVDSALSLHEASFVSKFESVWGLEHRGFDATARELGMFAQSNLLGGMGFFAGHIQTKTSEAGSSSGGGDGSGSGNVISEPMALFSATPSRSFFPRGFAWDEGFHQLLLQKWDAPLAADALAHWLGTLRGHASRPTASRSQGGGGSGGSGGGSGREAEPCPGGWLPREQVLGEAATRRVPSEFLAQDVAVGNPPTLLLLLDALVTKAGGGGGGPEGGRRRQGEEAASVEATGMDDAATRAWLTNELVPSLFPRAAAWLDWMLDSQANADHTSDGSSSSSSGGAARTYRWRGRNPTENKLMPTTFASGLDDYPRALFPSPDEAHLDLMCWLAHGAGLLARIATVLRDQATDSAAVEGSTSGLTSLQSAASYEAARVRYASIYSDLQTSLNAEHWVEDDQAYFDSGLTYPMPFASSSADAATAVRSAKTTEVATLGRDVVVSCLDPKTGAQKQVSVAFDYNPPDPTKQRDRQARKGCPRSHPQFQWPLAGGGENGLMMVGAVVPPSQQASPKKSSAAAAAAAVATSPRVQAAKHVGYVTLFPLLLTLLGPKEEPQLNALLDLMLDPRQLWSPYGLRSLSASDLFYRQANAPGDEPYWRGAVWMPINFLALRALKHYATPPPAQNQLPDGGGDTGGTVAATAAAPVVSEQTRLRCARAYSDLRANVLGLVLGQWSKAGSIWEHYDDETGLGLRSHPFTGWTALVLNVMAEEYSN